MLRPSAVVELVWQDETGSTAVTTLQLASSLTVAEIDTALTGVVSILASLTNCSLIKQRIRYLSAIGPTSLASDSTPITKTGIFFFSAGSSAPDALISVPSIKSSVFEETGPGAGVRIDLTNADVATFASAVVDSGISNPFGDAFVSLFAAYLQSRV